MVSYQRCRSGSSVSMTAEYFIIRMFTIYLTGLLLMDVCISFILAVTNSPANGSVLQLYLCTSVNMSVGVSEKQVSG